MDDEDDQNKHGIARIKEVLEAHVWPNINLKSANLDRQSQEETNKIEEVSDKLESVNLSDSKSFSDQLQMQSLLGKDTIE